ncbi:terpene cyclase/mutase family protein [Metabacillus sp. SLBN-84]
MNLFRRTEDEVQKRIAELRGVQRTDGSFRYCFEGGPMTDAFMIITLRSLGDQDEQLIEKLVRRLIKIQSHDGVWRLYEDEKEGNLTATVQAYTALVISGHFTAASPELQRAETFILANGGLSDVHFMTKWMLAVNGLYPWPKRFRFPLSYLLLPASSPFSMYQLSSYARIHFMPMILAMNKKYIHKGLETADFSHLYASKPKSIDWLSLQRDERSRPNLFLQMIRSIAAYPAYLHKSGYQAAERYILDRVEADGTLFSYASATFFMIYGLLATGYKEQSSQIQRAISGLKSLIYEQDGLATLENSTSTLWDTALLSYSLQASGVSCRDPMIAAASRFLLKRQHAKKADWAVHNSKSEAGGWGFSDINTNHPDNDDTAAALRALTPAAVYDPIMFSSWNRGTSWLLSMQNRDGGFAAFEKNTDSALAAMLPLENAGDAAADPSTADLTGRVLEYLGSFAGLKKNHPSAKAAINWLKSNQEKDGSWYGRWGVCYIYGTWAAITGMRAAGVSTNNASIQKAVAWLLSIQNEDGGFGESCRSCEVKSYVSLGYSTPSQTAWALDALLTVLDKEHEAVQLAVNRLLLPFDQQSDEHPTGIGLPKQFYIRYHSYGRIFPLLALSRYLKMN